MSRAYDDLVAATVSNGAPSARNLLVTVFGDSVAPHGIDTSLSVRSLTELIATFRVNERLVRTSLTRLVNDGVLAATTVGRRSFYGISAAATTTFQRGDDQIFRPAPVEWDGMWTMVVIDGFDAAPENRSDVRARLLDEGFVLVASNVLASATIRPEQVAEMLAHLDVGQVLVTRSRAAELGLPDVDRRLSRRAYGLDHRIAEYDDFLTRFSPYADGFTAELEPALAFKLRTLLIASYRRIVLADPTLPSQLLPEPWVGTTAQQLTASLYRQCCAASESFLEATVETATGVWPTLAVDLTERFQLDGSLVVD